MKPKGLDNERIENLMYLYGKTSLYADLLNSSRSCQGIVTNKKISYNNHIRQDRSSKFTLPRKKTGYVFKLPDKEGIKIRYEKKLVSGEKTKVEYHYLNDELFYIHLVCSDLPEDKKQRMAKHYFEYYLGEGANYDFENHNIVDDRGQVISFCNTFNFSINDFSVDFILDQRKFPV